MLLNALNQNFVISIPCNWIYPDVAVNWKPVLDRLYLNYNTCEDFINSLITSVNFPGVSTNPVQQQIQLYPVVKRPGYQMDLLASKQLTLNIKTTESYISYFLMRNLFERYLKLIDVKPLYMPPITISLLNDGGYETVSYVYKEITMTSISDLNLSYAATIGNFNTFSCQFSYNYYDVYMMSPEGKRILVATDVQPQMDFDKSLVTPDKDDIKQRPEEAQPVSTKKSLAEAVKILQESAEKVITQQTKSVENWPSNKPVMTSLSKNMNGSRVLQSGILKR